MDYKEEIKKSATSELTKKGIGLILLLASMLLSALLYRIWPALTKTQVGLLLAGSVLLNLGLLLAYLFRVRPNLKQRRNEIGVLQAELEKIKTALPYEFGARWTPQSEPRCPYCEGVLINYISRLGSRKVSTFDCSGCGRKIQLQDIDGSILFLHEAQAKLSGIDDAPSNKGIEPGANQQASHRDSLDEIDVRILLFIANAKYDDPWAEVIAQDLGIHVQIAERCLSRLHSADYVNRLVGLGNIVCYQMADKGRDYLIENKLIS